MVQWQLCTLDHLMASGFGRPFPRHGLQLLFWFANHCVTCEVMNSVVIMTLVSDCQPEERSYGFHRFGNKETLLPALQRPRRRQAVYFEVGNLNTESYPAAADLPTYVRENYESGCNHGNENIDRIIISYQVRTRVVEMVYVTEHDGEAFGSFSPDRTHEITSELIQVLQNPQLDLTTFLSQVGYCEATQMVPANNIEVMHPESCGQQIFNTTVQAYSGSTARTAQSDFIRAFSEASYRQLGIRIVPFYSDEQHQNRRPKAIRRPYALRQSYWPSAWEQPDEGFDEKPKKRNGGGGVSLVKILLSAGVLYLAAKCFSWLRNWWKADLNQNNLKMILWRTPSYQPACWIMCTRILECSCL